MKLLALIKSILILPFAIALTIFAIGNKQTVSLMWSPFHPAVDTPLYSVALVMLALGFLVGAFICWLSMKEKK